MTAGEKAFSVKGGQNLDFPPQKYYLLGGLDFIQQKNIKGMWLDEHKKSIDQTVSHRDQTHFPGFCLMTFLLLLSL